VFCELVQGAVLEETGYGLSTYLGDNEHSIIRVDDLSAHVSFHEPGKEAIAGDPGVASWTYEAYLAAPFAEIERAYLGEPAVEPAPLPRAKAKPKAKPKKQGNGKARPKANGKAAPRPAAKSAKSGDGKARPKANGNGKAKGAASRGKPARRRTAK
jgi:hypothetical protein